MDSLQMTPQGRCRVSCRENLWYRAGTIGKFLSKALPLQMLAVAIIPVMALAQDNPDADAGTGPDQVLLAQDNQDAAAQDNQDAAAQDDQDAAAQDDQDAAAQGNQDAAAQDNSQDAAAQDSQGAVAQDDQNAAAPGTQEPEVETVPTVPVAQDDPEPIKGDAVQLDNVVVRAQARDQSIQDVPLTVNAVTGDTMDKHGIRDFKDLASLIPGLQLESLSARAPIATLRGIAYDPNSNSLPTVSFFFNELYIAPFIAFQSMFDTERVEVIRGAQGTYWGTGPGGAITITPRKPNLGAWDQSILSSFSTNDLSNVQLAVGGPLADGFGIRVAVLTDRNGVDGIHSIPKDQDQEAETLAGRVILNAQLFDSIDATLLYQNLDSEIDIFTAIESLPGSTREPHLDASDRQTMSKNKELLEVSSQIAMLRIEWDDAFAGHLLRTLTATYPQTQKTLTDFDVGNAWPAARSDQLLDIKYSDSFIQGVTLESPTDQAWTYRLGASYSQVFAHVDLLQHQNATTSPDPNTPPQFSYDLYVEIPIDVSGYGGSAATGYQINDKWTVEAGVNYSSSTVEQQVYVTPRNHPANLDQQPGLSNIPLLPADQVVSTAAPVTGTVNVSYRITPDFLSYLSLARSYRPAGLNIGAPTDIEKHWLRFYEETSLSQELGIKTDWLDGRLRFNAAVFHQPFDGYIARSPNIPYDGDRNGQQDNAFALTFNGDAIVTGTEAELAYAWGENLQLSLTGSYSNAVFDDAAIPCAKYDANGNPVFTDENGNSGQQFSHCKSSGPLGSVPKFSAAFTPEYTWPLSGFDLFVRGLYKYDDKRVQQDGTELPGVGVTNLFLGAHNAAQTWEVSVWAKNLFDEAALYAGRQGEANALSDGTAFGIPNSAQTFHSGYTTVYLIREREVGLTFRYNGTLGL